MNSKGNSKELNEEDHVTNKSTKEQEGYLNYDQKIYLDGESDRRNEGNSLNYNEILILDQHPCKDNLEEIKAQE